MIYDDDIRKAARRAEKGVRRAIASLRARRVKREDDLTGVLKGNLSAELEGQVGGLTWHCTILTTVAENPPRNTSSGQTFSFTFDLMLDT